MRNVDDQHDGCLGHGRNVRGGCEAVAPDLPVVQPHDAFDDREVRRRGAGEEQGYEAVLADEMRIEVAPRLAGRERVIARVDVVRTDLVSRDHVTRRRQCGHEPGRHSGLAVPGGGGCDDEAGKRYHSMPR